MLDIERTSALIWRFETARLEDNTIIGFPGGDDPPYFPMAAPSWAA